MSAAGCCAAGWRAASSSCAAGREPRTRSRRCWRAGCRPGPGSLTCSASRAAGGWLIWSCRSRSASRSMPALRQIAFLDAEIAAVDKLIARQALDWPEIRRLMTVSGVNLICAATFLAAIGEPIRFIDQPQAGRLPRARSEGPPVRRGAGTVWPDLQARIGERAVGAGRGGVERGQAARPAARVLRAHPRPARSRQSDRRDRPQTHGPVLVHAAPRSEDYAHQRPALTKKKLRQLELTAGAPARTKQAAGIWSTNRAILHAERALAEQAEVSYQRMVKDQQAGRPSEKWARARHRSAHKLGPRRAKPRGRLKAPDVCASLRQSPAPTNNLTARPRRRQPRRR